jgi:hypothetical protein
MRKNLPPFEFSASKRRAPCISAYILSLVSSFLLAKVGRKIFLQKDRRAVVLMVVDASDFDGSLPIDAIRCDVHFKRLYLLHVFTVYRTFPISTQLNIISRPPV